MKYIEREFERRRERERLKIKERVRKRYIEKGRNGEREKD